MSLLRRPYLRHRSNTAFDSSGRARLPVAALSPASFAKKLATETTGP